MDFSTYPLVETAWLEAHLSDDDLCVVDARWRGDGMSLLNSKMYNLAASPFRD